MGFVRKVHADATTRKIARLTAGMRSVPVGEVALAPRVCGRCLGRGRMAHGGCDLCGGVGTIRRFVPDDPGNVVLVAGPSGLGYQQLVAVALADGRPALIHWRREAGVEACLYMPSARPAHVVRPIRRAAGQQEHALLRGSPRR